MSREIPKPQSAPSTGAPAPKGESPSDGNRVTRNNTGRVKFDDRGNAVWEWAVTTGAFGTDVSTQRLKKLENQSLSLADDPPPPTAVAKQNPKGVTQGYSPYDSGLLVKEQTPPKKKKDLRRLSEWLKLREQASRNKQDE